MVPPTIAEAKHKGGGLSMRTGSVLPLLLEAMDVGIAQRTEIRLDGGARSHGNAMGRNAPLDPCGRRDLDASACRQFTIEGAGDDHVVGADAALPAAPLGQGQPALHVGITDDFTGDEKMSFALQRPLQAGAGAEHRGRRTEPVPHSSLAYHVGASIVLHPVHLPFTKTIVSSSPEIAAMSTLIAQATRILLVALALGAATGCATSFVYERADRFANRWVDGHVELEPAQQSRFEQDIAALHEWHRREQLPQYAEWLRNLARRLEQDEPVSAGELQAHGETLAAFWRTLAGEAKPALVRLGTTLDETQVEALLGSLREQRETEFEAAEQRSQSGQEQRRVRSMERFLRRWAGRLQPEQRASVQAWAASLEPSLEATHRNRLGWIDALEQALQRRDDEDYLLAAARVLLVRPAERWSPEYAALVERNAAKSTAFLAEFLNGLEPRQRARAVARLERLAADFEAISAAG